MTDEQPYAQANADRPPDCLDGRADPNRPGLGGGPAPGPRLLSRARRRGGRWRPFPYWTLVRTMVFSVLGAMAAVAIWGPVHQKIGPFDTTVSIHPALRGESTLHLPPLGTIELKTHRAPVAIDVQVDELRADEAQKIAKNPEVLRQLETEIGADARAALIRVFARTMAVALLGGAAGGLVARARPRAGDAVRGAVVAGLLASATVGATVATFDSSAISEPRYTGLLTTAPQAVGDVQAVVDHFHDYSAQLADLVGNLASLYQAAQGLPTLTVSSDTIRILHVSDIHNNPQAFDLIDQLVPAYKVDAVVDTGDITDWGSAPESQQLGRVAKLAVPYVWVRGNHDSQQVQKTMAAIPNAVVLDNSSAVVAGLRFWGIGDPRYTPDKDQPTGAGVEADEADTFAPTVAADLAAADPATVDAVLTHDPRTAADLGGMVPLVLAGHIHEPRQSMLGDSTTVLVEGSTGGAGLNTLQGTDSKPHPLTASVLYFDRATKRLLVYDQIVVDGLGGAGARIDRHVLATRTDTGTLLIPPDSSSAPGSAAGPEAPAGAGGSVAPGEPPSS